MGRGVPEVGMQVMRLTVNFISEKNISYHSVQYVNINLGTETFDEIAKDEKVTTEAALGLIGGTMGLLTGFSILSGVEIIYYFGKFLISLLKTN